MEVGGLVGRIELGRRVMLEVVCGFARSNPTVTRFGAYEDNKKTRSSTLAKPRADSYRQTPHLDHDPRRRCAFDREIDTGMELSDRRESRADASLGGRARDHQRCGT